METRHVLETLPAGFRRDAINIQSRGDLNSLCLCVQIRLCESLTEHGKISSGIVINGSGSGYSILHYSLASLRRRKAE
ncbi:hypothetical protein QQF64_012769 [Cirrhinus molitorella]|uniref:Uncharacterized protein n=1 Tax=Cirrhinus molitorella TaxID=172907 RepID=A0ABR3LWG9_9TELE